GRKAGQDHLPRVAKRLVSVHAEASDARNRGVPPPKKRSFVGCFAARLPIRGQLARGGLTRARGTFPTCRHSAKIHHAWTPPPKQTANRNEGAASRWNRRSAADGDAPASAISRPSQV